MAAGRLIGRDDALERLRAAVGAHGVVAVCGPPGIGKSALVQRAFPTAVHCTPPLAEGLARTLGLQRVGWPAIGGVLAHRGVRHVVVDGVPAPQAVDALRAEAGVAVVITTTTRPADRPVVPLGPLAAHDARALLAAVGPPLTPDAERVLALAEGQPWALVWAGPRAALIGWDGVAERLAAGAGPLDALWRALDAAQRDHLVRLAVLPTPFDVDTAGTVLPGDALEACLALTDAGVLTAGATGLAPLGLLRQHAHRVGDPAILRDAARAFAVGAVDRADAVTAAADDPSALGTLLARVPGRAALEHAACSDDPVLAERAWSHLHRFAGPLDADARAALDAVIAGAPGTGARLTAARVLAAEGRFADAARVVGEGVDDAPPADRSARLDAWVTVHTKADAEPLDTLLAALDTAEALAPDPCARSRIQRTRGELLRHRFDPRAPAVLREAEQTLREHGALLDAIRCGLSANAAVLDAEPQRGVAVAERLRAELPDHAPPRLRAHLAMDESTGRMALGEHTRARVLVEGALAIYRDVGDRANAAVALENLAVLLSETGDLDQADALLVEAEVEYRRFAPVVVARALVNRAMVAIFRGAFQRAKALLREAATASSAPAARTLVHLLDVWVDAELGVRSEVDAVDAAFRGAAALSAARAALVDGDAGPARELLATVDREGLDALPGLVHLRRLVPRLRARLVPPLVVRDEARRVTWGSVALDLRRVGPTRRVLWHLVVRRRDAPGAWSDTDLLFEAGWPGQAIRQESAAHRVYVALSTSGSAGSRRSSRPATPAGGSIRPSC